MCTSKTIKTKLRMYLSVYFGVRKSCATARERQILRKYPWGGIEKQWRPYYREIRHKNMEEDYPTLFGEHDMRR